mgnify:CR=1 FL=1
MMIMEAMAELTAFDGSLMVPSAPHTSRRAAITTVVERSKGRRPIRLTRKKLTRTPTTSTMSVIMVTRNASVWEPRRQLRLRNAGGLELTIPMLSKKTYA